MKDRIALVTGGAKGMGASHVKTLAEAGAYVYFTDVDETIGNEKQKELGNQTCFIKHGVSSETDWGKVVNTIESAHGCLDILVNNAGILLYDCFGEMKLDRYMKVIN